MTIDNWSLVLDYCQRQIQIYFEVEDTYLFCFASILIAIKIEPKEKLGADSLFVKYA